MNGFDIDDGRSSSHVKEIFARAAGAGFASLPTSDVVQAVLEGNALAEPLSTFWGCYELTQTVNGRRGVG